MVAMVVHMMILWHHNDSFVTKECHAHMHVQNENEFMYRCW